MFEIAFASRYSAYAKAVAAFVCNESLATCYVRSQILEGPTSRQLRKKVEMQFAHLKRIHHLGRWYRPGQCQPFRLMRRR